MMKLILASLIIILAAFADTSCSKDKDCMGEPKTDYGCEDEYKPVCGCNGVTYSNACKADAAGVKSWKNGRCSP